MKMNVIQANRVTSKTADNTPFLQQVGEQMLKQHKRDKNKGSRRDNFAIHPFNQRPSHI